MQSGSGASPESQDKDILKSLNPQNLKSSGSPSQDSPQKKSGSPSQDSPTWSGLLPHPGMQSGRQGYPQIPKTSNSQILKVKSTVWPQVGWLCTQQIEIYSLRLCHFTWDLSSMYDSSYIWSFRDDHCDGFHHTANLVLTMHSANAAGSRSRWVSFPYTDHNGSRLLWVCSVCAACIGFAMTSQWVCSIVGTSGQSPAVRLQGTRLSKYTNTNTRSQIQKYKYKLAIV